MGEESEEVTSEGRSLCVRTDDGVAETRPTREPQGPGTGEVRGPESEERARGGVGSRGREVGWGGKGGRWCGEESPRTRGGAVDAEDSSRFT